MLTAPTIEAAAEAAGIARRTAYRYLGDPSVKRALSQALDDALAQATSRAVTAMSTALGVLEEVYQDRASPPAARVSAARTILTSAPSLREAHELAERVRALEAALSESKGGRDEHIDQKG